MKTGRALGTLSAVLYACAATWPILSALGAGIESAEESTSYWKPYPPGTNTLALYPFDGANPLADLSGRSAPLALGNGVELCAEGKFGGGLRFQASHAPVKAALGGCLFGVPSDSKFDKTSVSQRFILDVWVKPEALPPPGQEAVILYKPLVPEKANGLKLAIKSDGSVVWWHRTCSAVKYHPEWFMEMSSAPGVMKPGQWRHLAVYAGAYGGGSGEQYAYLWVDGTMARKADSGWRYINYTKPGEWGNSELYLGGDDQGASGFAGILDQVRVANGVFRRFFPTPDESFTDPEKKRALSADPTCVASGDNVLFYAGFDGTLEAEARGNRMPTKAPKAAIYAPGVRGQAVVFDGNRDNSVNYAAKEHFNPRAGALEFWFKPLNWQQAGTVQQNFCQIRTGGPWVFIPNDGFSVHIGSTENMSVEYRPDTWMHMLLSWADRHVALYVDGEKKIETLMPKPYDPNGSYTDIALALYAAKPMLMDEFTIYRRPLSDEEAMNHYRRYFPKPPLTPLGKFGSIPLLYQGVGKLWVAAYPRGAASAADSFALGLLLNDRALAENKVAMKDGLATGLMEGLPVPLPPGNVVSRVEAFDAQGQSLGTEQKPLPFKRYPWLGNNIGMEERVLKPWTPIAVTKAGRGKITVGVWGRDYLIGGDGLIQQIVNQGKPMLADPMRLESAAGGRECLFKGKGVEVVSKKATEVAWRARGSLAVGNAKPLPVTVEGRMEYDGCVFYTFKFAPPAGPAAELDRLSLVVPLKAEYCRQYWMTGNLGAPGGTGVMPMSGMLPTADGELFSSKIFYEGLRPEWVSEVGVWTINTALEIAGGRTERKLQPRWKPTVGSFIPGLYLYNDELGLSFMADSDAGWSPTNAAAAIDVEKKGGTAFWRFNFVAAPATVDRPRAIVLSLMATPEKPKPENWRKHFWRGGPKYPEPAGAIRMTVFGGVSCAEEGTEVVYDPERAKATVAACHAKGEKQINHINTVNFSWGRTLFDNEIAHEVDGGQQYSELYTRSKIDYGIYSFKQWKDLCGLDGIYFDTGQNWPTLNAISGTAYVLPDGRIQPGWAMFGQRELYKREAHVFGDLGTENVSGQCGFCAPQISGWLFSSVSGGEYAIRYDMDFYPGTLDHMRLGGNTGKSGSIMLWMLYSQYDGKDPVAFQKFFRHMYAKALLLDAKWNSGSMNYPTAFYEYGYADPDVRFIGFWNNPFVTPAPSEDLPISLYLKPNGRALLMVSNLSAKDIQASFTFDVKRAGGKGTAEALDGERFEGTDPVARAKDPRFQFRGGCARMPGGDEALRRIVSRSTPKGLEINLLVPSHDYRLVDILPNCEELR